ncbi:MAG: DUF6125 family protein [Bacteroides sp.]|nr:DUF6125 family protein [Bacteroides sp.]
MILDDLSKDQLKELVKIYARNIYALDGVWFQSIEQMNGMDEAMVHDRNAWRRFTETEARRIKKFLGLPDQSGLDGLAKALSCRFSALANTEVEFIREDNSLVYRVINCRVQTARKNKGMPYHPCKSVGIIEHAYFALIIDDRIECEPVSCFPDVADESCACSWRFTLSRE